MAETDIIQQLTQALDKFNSCVEKKVEEVRQQKAAVQAMREEIFNTKMGVQYVRHDGALILSAPKIIIGNVDDTGCLMGGSEVIIRGNNVSLEATGNTNQGGSITSRAASIRQIAVDPGIDGCENVVCTGRSEITSQARGITLITANDEDSFVDAAAGSSGIHLESESSISLSATPSVERKSKMIDNETQALNSQISNLKTNASTYKNEIDGLTAQIKKLSEKQYEYNTEETDIRTDYQEVAWLHEQFNSAVFNLSGTVTRYVNTLAALAEANRRKTALVAIKKTISSKKTNFKTETIDASIAMDAESFQFTSRDGDGNLRDNKEAGMNIQVPHLGITTKDAKGALIKDSNIFIATKDFALTTVNPALDDKQEKGDMPADGSIKMTSKDILVQAIDQELKDKQVPEKALTKDGKIVFRAENITASATDTEGKSTGKLNLNAKNIQVASMDVDKEKRTDKEMAQGSQMVLLSEKAFVGSNKKNAKLVQVAAEKVGIIGKDTAELQQNGKAVVTANGGNLTAGGSKVELQGNTTIAGNAEIKGETKGPKGTFDQVQASQAFKSPNINDTMGAGVPSPAGQPSAKMQEEEPQT